MRQHLAESLDAAGVHPYRKKSSDDALSWLAGNAHDSRIVTAAAWDGGRTNAARLPGASRHGRAIFRFAGTSPEYRDAAPA
jgi:hypothetical protein